MPRDAYTYGGKTICFTCRTCNCYSSQHKTLYVGAKCRVPKKHDKKGWQKLENICFKKSFNDYSFTTKCPEYFAWKEIYADVKRRLDKSRKTHYQWNVEKHPPPRIDEQLNAYGWILYDHPTRFIY